MVITTFELTDEERTFIQGLLDMVQYDETILLLVANMFRSSSIWKRMGVKNLYASRWDLEYLSMQLCYSVSFNVGKVFAKNHLSANGMKFVFNSLLNNKPFLRK